MENALLARAGFDVATTGKERPVEMVGLHYFKKLLRMVKLTILLLALTCVQARASGQNISLTLKNASLEKVFAAIERQSDYHFIYTKEEVASAKAVSISVNNALLTDVLEQCFKGQPVTYKVQDKYIIVKRDKEQEDRVQDGKLKMESVKGKVADEEGNGIAGATIKIKGSEAGVASNERGEFELDYDGVYSRIVVSSIGYETQEVYFKGESYITIILQRAINSLDETLVIAYGKTTRRLNTGNVSKLDASEISKQPVSNPLAALEGRVPGLLITQSSGYASGAIGVQLRGRNSLIQGSEPLFVIDGIPLAAQNISLNQLTNAASAFGTTPAPGGVSPFYLINPNDLESIEVLKDADATAIYGSRGANGVILITTKKGKEGKTKVSTNIFTGWSKTTRTIDMLNTPQYFSMRREAFRNDGINLTGTNAADLLIWDSTRSIDFKELLIGGTANTLDINSSASGGSNKTQFHISGGYHRETTVLPVTLADYRGSLHTVLNHVTNKNRFKIQLSSLYSYTKNTLPTGDAATYISRPPNMKLYDSTGRLNWQEGGVSFKSMGLGTYANPLAIFETKYTGRFQNFTSSLLLDYAILKALHLKTSIGYNLTIGNETSVTPTTALDPFDTQTPSSYFATSENKTWIIEPQIEYEITDRIGKISLLAGTTFQNRTSNGIYISAQDYTSDLLLYSISGAGNVSTSNNSSEYKYNALFGRLNYNFKDRYIINLSMRRDGSSRFGPGKQFNNFGSIGSAWIFSNERFIKKSLPGISFGKIRGSYGTSGNDLIGDYQFLDSWTTSNTTYQGIPSLNPTGLYNPDLAWEVNKKFEAAIELGLFNDKIKLSAAYFRNRSSNQLVSYNLPIQTGFASIRRNLNAVIENKGYEFTIESISLVSTRFKWSSQINFSVGRNKLLSFPGLSSSSYANTFVIGQPVSMQRLYKFSGADPSTGFYKFSDVDSNGILNRNDRTVFKNLQPQFYGGFNNVVKLRSFEISVFIQFVKQMGLNYLNTLSTYTPGYKYRNQPTIVLDRWQKTGDKSSIQRFTTIESGNTNQSNNLAISDAIYSDASFIRIKNVSITYNLSDKVINKLRVGAIQVYLRAQNLFTITKYKGADPENQNMYRMPPLRTITTGILFTF